MSLPLVINPGDMGHISHHEEIHGLLAPIVSPFTIAEDADGLFSARPAAGLEGRYYYATDTGVLYRDSGAGWTPVHDMLHTWEASLLSTGNNLTKLKMPSCIASKGVAQTIANNSATVITFGTEDFDNDAMHSVSTNTGRITFNRAGIYLVGAHLTWEIGPEALSISIRANGTTPVGATRLGTAGVTPVIALAAAIQANIADYIEVLAYPTTSPAASYDITEGRFWATLVSSL